MAPAKLAQPLDLQFGLDFPLPDAVCVGQGTALFVCGWCFSARGPLESLAIAVDGQEQPLSAWGMPRREVMEAWTRLPRPATEAASGGSRASRPGRPG